jgi:hypothetical protein
MGEVDGGAVPDVGVQTSGCGLMFGAAEPPAVAGGGGAAFFFGECVLVEALLELG